MYSHFKSLREQYVAACYGLRQRQENLKRMEIKHCLVLGDSEQEIYQKNVCLSGHDYRFVF